MNQKQDTYPDRCVCCGAPVPEGRMICRACEGANDRSVAKWLLRRMEEEKLSRERDKR